MKRIILFALAFYFCSICQVSADVITVCGGSKGYAYFFPGGIVPADEEGWQPDQIPKGQIIFTMDGEKPDIIIKDAINKTRSVKEDRALVEVLYADPKKGTILIMVFYPAGALEHYLFQLDEMGSGRVVWGTAKAAGPIITNKLMVADCHK
ncbi:MAG: hypothetical protein O3A78_11085 [Nitrospinae bacterium]|nr:hypothetical protein [Nitrospinota bacterium]MDA1110332.1 hypothetical protein [Nitrospinota bacterium]